MRLFPPTAFRPARPGSLTDIAFSASLGLALPSDWMEVHRSVFGIDSAQVPMRSVPDSRDVAVLIGGTDPAKHPQSWYGAAYHSKARHPNHDSGIEDFLV